MISDYNIVGNILFSQSLLEIRQQLKSLRKDRFEPDDRIVITQDVVDEYPYVDGVGQKLISIQKIINQVDISNCFILLVTANKDVSYEIDFVTRYFSTDDTPIQYQLIDGDYEKIIKKYENTACRYLWDHFYLGPDGNVNPCCIADHRFPLGDIDRDDDSKIAENAQQIRAYMTEGYRPRACGPCYEKEDGGIKSHRAICDPEETKVEITNLDVRLSNICNFKCRMCSEYFSSAIRQETIEIYGKNSVLGFEKVSLDKEVKQVKNKRLEKVEQFLTKDLKSIYFAGGEPLLTGEHYAILDRLLEIDNTDLRIEYNTNMSTLVYKQRSAIDMWRQFKDITIGASIDAGGAAAEYLRHGTVWQDIVDNIRNVKQNAPHVKLHIASTVSNLNIENLIDLQSTWIDQGFLSVEDFQMRVLTTPNFLSPAMLPKHHKDRLGALIQKHIHRLEGTALAQQWHNVLQWMNNNDYTFALDDFVHRTRVLDSHRKESFLKVFPEFQDLYNHR